MPRVDFKTMKNLYWAMVGKLFSMFTIHTPRRAVLGVVSWKDHKSNNELYGNLSRITSTLRVRRLKFIGHMWRRKVEVVSQVLLREPKQGARKRGRPALTYVDQLRKDTGLSTEELKNIMDDREE